MNRFRISLKYFLYPGIFLISLSVLMFELALTRIFSIMQWNYLAFMIISIAFLGYGASGTFLTVTPSLTKKNRKEQLPGLLSHFALMYGLSIFLALFLINRIPFDLYRLNVDSYQWFYLTTYYLAIALPFFFAGTCISLAITHLPMKVSRLYFYDLTGASLGCLAFLFFTNHINIIKLLIMLSVFGFASSFLFSLAQGKRLFSLLPLILIIILALVNFFSYWSWSFSLPINHYKELFSFLRYPETKILYQRENSFSQIKIVESPAVKHAPGLSLNFKERIPEQLGILTDDSGLSAITRFNGNIESICFTDFLSNALGFHLSRNQNRVLVIGSGGGLDILSAIYHGCTEIEAIELNPLVIDLMKGQFADYSGQLYNRPEVAILPGEGRSVLKNIDHNFDLIQISLVGSATASTGGFHSISENYLYTVEGMIDFLEHLSPNGVICITRWLLFPPRESVKLTTIALQALEKVGVENPENHIALIRSWGTTTFICSQKPIDGEMIDIIISFCQERSFDSIYFPGIRLEQANQNHRLEKPYYYLAISDLMEHFRQNRMKSFYQDYFFNVSPATDNSPFFFYFLKWSNIPTIIRDTSYWQPIIEWGNLIVFATLLQGMLFSLIFIFLPLLIKRASPGKGWYFPLLYFAALGLGYMLIEISFIQKFILYLTYPTYTTSAIIFSFLFFSGLGSHFSQRWQRKTIHYLRWIIPVICLFLVLYQRLIPTIFQYTFHLPLIVRFLLTCSLLSPLSFLMGMPFPLGIHFLAERRERMIPWVWATNNFCSILASVLAVIIAISSGFQAVGYLAAGIYLVGLFGIVQAGKVSRS
ncbi:MAG: hypothetical protein PHI72_04255 [Atribacterota bacterium]|nr:hypothetical protein [Atribacterota bacterium]MDD5636854.1 hypothetical protein [Atribacterota bacterium]